MRTLRDFPRLDRWWKACAMKSRPWNSCSEKRTSLSLLNIPLKCKPLSLQTSVVSFMREIPVSVIILFKECTIHSKWAPYLESKPQTFKKNLTKKPTHHQKRNCSTSGINIVARKGSNLLKVESWIDVCYNNYNELDPLLLVKDCKYFKVRFHRQNVLESDLAPKAVKKLPKFAKKCERKIFPHLECVVEKEWTLSPNDKE